MRRRKFITLIGSAERLIGGTTMRGILQRSVIAATTVLAIAAFPDPAKAGVVVTAPFYGGYGYYDYPYTYGYANYSIFVQTPPDTTGVSSLVSWPLT